MIKNFLVLTKPRLVFMALITAACGFFLAARKPVEWTALFIMLAGSALLGGGVNALNQWWERQPDSKMHRTQNRPVPAGQLLPIHALIFGWGLSLSGVAVLFTLNLLSGFLALATLGSYVFIYTPMKQKTVLNTFVGAIPGAMPVFLGWSAAQGVLDFKAWAFFLLLYFWQLPHFFAIAWMHRTDYENAGFKMMSGGDRGAERTSRQIFIWSWVFFAATFLPVFSELSGSLYFLGAFVTGIFFLAFALYVASHRLKDARALMVASILHLGLLNVFLFFDRI